MSVNSVLSFPAPGKTGNHRLGSSQLSLRRERPGRGREAQIRSLLHPPLLAEARRDDRAENSAHHAFWQRTLAEGGIRVRGREDRRWRDDLCVVPLFWPGQRRPSNFLHEGMTKACRMGGVSLILVQRRRHPYSSILNEIVSPRVTVDFLRRSRLRSMGLRRHYASKHPDN